MSLLALGKECKRCKTVKVVLNSRVASGSPAEGVIYTREIDSVISINVHQVVVPIIGLNNFARLSLEVGSLSLNYFNDNQTPAYSIGVPLSRHYVGDTVGIYHWPSDLFPIHEANEPYTKLANDWHYRWTLPDGTPYPLGANDHWIAEFFVVQKCYEHVDRF